jgi:hypothetical protein
MILRGTPRSTSVVNVILDIAVLTALNRNAPQGLTSLAALVPNKDAIALDVVFATTP